MTRPLDAAHAYAKGRQFQRLVQVAPRAGDPLLHLLAAALASGCSRDALLVVADALAEASADEALNNHAARSADLRRLGDVFRKEAATRKEEPRV